MRAHAGGISQNELIGWWKFGYIDNIGFDSSGVLGDRYHVFGQPTTEECFLGKCAVFDGRSGFGLMHRHGPRINGKADNKRRSVHGMICL